MFRQHHTAGTIQFLELNAVQVLINDDTVNCLDVELGVLLCLECNLGNFYITIQGNSVTLIYVCRIYSCVTIAVQTVLAVVVHTSHI